MAVTLTYPERVTDHNINKLRLRVLSGESPGGRPQGPAGAGGQ
jgi:hypothetical protein